MIAYADTSFLVSLYIIDCNSAEAAAQMELASLPVLLTAIGELESANAFALRVFRRELQAPGLETAMALLRADIKNGIFSVYPVTAAIYEKAKEIAFHRTPRLGTRTLDILHVASALVLKADSFLTFDTSQAKLAKVEGLKLPRLA